jgi:phenylalanyl-tRNA synthetase beta chain
MHPIDIVEEVAIAYGYENFVPQFPNIFTIGEENDFERFQNQIANMLVGLDLYEVNTYHLTQEDYQTTKMNLSIPIVEVQNPVSAEYHALRAWLLPSLIEILRNNRNHEYPQRIFGTGIVFKKANTETGVEEIPHLSIAVSAERTTYTQMKQIVEAMMRYLDLPFTINEYEHNSFIQGRVAEAVVNDVHIGFWGELHPSILENWQLEMPTIALEFNMQALYKASKELRSPTK